MPSDAVKNRCSVVFFAAQVAKAALSRVASAGMFGTKDHGSQIFISDAFWFGHPRKTAEVGFGFVSVVISGDRLIAGTPLP